MHYFVHIGEKWIFVIKIKMKYLILGGGSLRTCLKSFNRAKKIDRCKNPIKVRDVIALTEKIIIIKNMAH